MRLILTCQYSRMCLILTCEREHISKRRRKNVSHRPTQLHNVPARVLGHLVGVCHPLTLLLKLSLVGLLEVLYNLLAVVKLA